MKRLMTVMFALAFLTATVSVSFGQDTTKKGDTKNGPKKKGPGSKKKGGDVPKKGGGLN